MTQTWPMVLAVGLFGGLGLAGLFQPSGPTPEAAAVIQAKLDAVPMTVGNWAGTPTPYSAKALKQAGAVAHVCRTYRRADPPAEVAVIVLAGDPGEMGAHDPAVCFAGAGYTPAGGTSRKACGPDALWTARYEASDPPQTVQVCWGWSPGDRWAASDNARFEFASRATLYKLYVTRGVAAGPPAKTDPTDDFLAAFLPATSGLTDRP
jgi:hypothetical protein